MKAPAHGATVATRLRWPMVLVAPHALWGSCSTCHCRVQRTCSILSSFQSLNVECTFLRVREWLVGGKKVNGRDNSFVDVPHIIFTNSW